MKLAPVVLFVYARPEHTRQTLQSLAANDLAGDTHLIVYADGPKANASADTLAKIEQTRAIINEKKWCGTISLITSADNKGLARNIVEGVTEVINQYGCAIVLEDDLMLAPGFLKFMNEALDLYANDEQVMHVAGYMFPVQAKIPELFFLKTMFCWGWATWKSAWDHYDGNAGQLYMQLQKKGMPADFNVHKSNEFYKTLKANADGELSTWAIKWMASIYLNNGLCLVPGKSLVRNIGHDGSGLHCGENEEMAAQPIGDYVTVNRIPLEVSDKAFKALKHYYARKEYNVPNRVLNRLERIFGLKL